MSKLTSQEFRASKEKAGNVELKISSSETVELTHLEKVYWPDDGFTKGDLLQYYTAVTEYILPYLQDRPAILKRYPNGIKPLTDKDAARKHDRGTDFRNRDGGFFQQNVDPATAPGFLKTILLTTTETTHPVNYAVYTGLASLLYLTNLGTIAHNPGTPAPPASTSPTTSCSTSTPTAPRLKTWSVWPWSCAMRCKKKLGWKAL